MSEALMTSIEEAIRSGAVRLVPVEATDGMYDAAYELVERKNGTWGWDKQIKSPGDLWRGMLSASPDHTPALLALIEERDRLKVERDEGPKGKSWAQFAKEQADRALAAEAERDALREAVEKLYYAAYWAPDRDCDADNLWASVRDAAGIARGQTFTRLGLPRALTMEPNDG